MQRYVIQNKLLLHINDLYAFVDRTMKAFFVFMQLNIIKRTLPFRQLQSKRSKDCFITF